MRASPRGLPVLTTSLVLLVVLALVCWYRVPVRAMAPAAPAHSHTLPAPLALDSNGDGLPDVVPAPVVLAVVGVLVSLLVTARVCPRLQNQRVAPLRRPPR